jgi:hypothetical protein
MKGYTTQRAALPDKGRKRPTPSPDAPLGLTNCTISEDFRFDLLDTPRGVDILLRP